MKVHTAYILFFAFAMVSCGASKDSMPREIIWEVSNELVSCEGVATQSCLQVREPGSEEWTLFYDTIQGFNYKEGYSYTIKVNETAVENPPADASSKAYELITIIEQRNVSKIVNGIPQLEGGFQVTTLNGRDVSDKDLTILINPVNRNITGFSGCNTYNLTYKQKGTQLRFSQVSTTRRYCENIGSLEKEFLITYIQGDSFTLEDGILKIYDLENQILEAKATK
ncbi:DUF4377 domain-containing protein [Dokdonia sinensis]|nr:DUF4377 domain-containing protein [Dokdonia sinensis]